MLEHWHEFYELIGTAASALLALLFVAVSVGAGALLGESASRARTRTYMSPVAFHFTVVLFVSALALAPAQTPHALGVVFGCTAVAGFAYAGFIIRRLLTDNVADLPDRLAYGLAPLVAYALILLAAGLFMVDSTRAADVLALGAVVLLIINVRNAWDLLLAMARRQNRSG